MIKHRQRMVSAIAMSDASVHFARDSWNIRDDESLQAADRKARVVESLVDSTVDVAAAPEQPMKRIEEVLTPRNRRIIAPAMLQKEIRAVRLEHSPDFF